MSKVNWTVVTGAIIGGVLGFFAVKAFANEVTDAMDAVWKINNNCSAVVIKSVPEGDEHKIGTYMLTAAHCVKANQGVINADIYDGRTLVTNRSFVYDRVHIQVQHDLGWIKLRDSTTLFKSVKVADTRKVDVGDDVYAIGFPKAAVKAITRGMISQITDLSRLTKKTSPDPVYLTSVPIVGGNSGGGLFQKVNGKFELIGVASRGMMGFEHVSIFIPLDKVREFLKYKEVF